MHQTQTWSVRSIYVVRIPAEQVLIYPCNPLFYRKAGGRRSWLIGIGRASRRKTIIAEAIRLLNDHNYYQQRSAYSNPFGDGKAIDRIIDGIKTIDAAPDHNLSHLLHSQQA